MADKDDNPNKIPETPQRQTGVLLKTRPKTGRPGMFIVLLLNDDFTPMDFVIHIL
jgi:ATP-dependent Clp protease adaptor protein ClpS